MAGSQINSYNAYNLYDRNQYNSVPAGYNQYAQSNPNMYAYANPQMQDRFAFGNTEPPVAQAVNSGKKNNKKMWLIAGGVALAAAGIFLTKGKLWAKEKPVSFEKVQQNLAEIFGKKDLTKEQAEAMLQQYQEVYKIKDKNTFIEKLFNQVKKDYGYEHSSKQLKILDKPVFKDGTKKLGSNSKENLEVYSTQSKNELFETIAHEFRHMKQDEYMYRSNPGNWGQIRRDSFIEYALSDPKLKKIYNKDPAAFNELVSNKYNEELEIMRKDFGHLSKFDEGSDEYRQAEKYLEAKKSYINDRTKGYTEYRNNLLEVEAWGVGAKMREIANFIEKSK